MQNNTSGIKCDRLVKTLGTEVRSLNYSTVSQIENNAQSVDIATLEKYIKALGKELILEIR
jgi:hypothetical protein